MKTSVLMLTVTIFFVLIHITGCESDITSSAGNRNIEQSMNKKDEPVNATSLQIKLNLMPNQTYSLNYENTGYRAIYSIDIDNCTEANKFLEITGYADDEIILLNCNSANLYVYSIDIKNISPKPVEVYLLLKGTAKVIKKYDTPDF